ncbi:MAG: ABC transporter ATP-binding protein [Mycoplasma sp.]
MPSKQNAITYKNVCFSYDNSSPILKNLNCEWNYGEMILITGQSGSGKSSIINIATGIIPNVIQGRISGDVLLNGTSIRNKKVGELCYDIGLVLQNPDLQIIQRFVEDEIAFGCENFAFERSSIQLKINEMVEIMNLDPKSIGRQLSGGQKQKLVTASILATSQKIIILDEPLANLDKKSSLELLGILRHLAKEHNFCVIVVEHRIDLVSPFIDKAYELEDLSMNEVEISQMKIKEESKIIKDIVPTHEHDKTFIELKDVSYKICHKQILENINLEIKTGERLVLLGENGCGKTTLMRLMSKITKPSKGQVIQYFDENLKQKKKGNRKWFEQVGVVYQNPNYQLFMPSVRQEIEFNAKDVDYVNYVIKLFRLEKLLDRHPHSLSEGQKRKVSIAAIVAAKPKIIFLDEPTVGQDLKGLNEIVKILNELNHQNNTTIVTITHDVRCASALCDRSIIISNNTISEIGKKELVDKFFEQYNNPKNIEI